MTFRGVVRNCWRFSLGEQNVISLLSQQTTLNISTASLYNKLRHKFVCADNIAGYIKESLIAVPET